MSTAHSSAREVADLEVGERSEWRATFDQAELFDALPTDDGRLPFVLAGTVTGGSSEPPELLAAVNGTLAGVVGGYRPGDGGWAFTGYVADLFEAGPNEVALYEVVGEGDDVSLRPAELTRSGRIAAVQRAGADGLAGPNREVRRSACSQCSRV